MHFQHPGAMPKKDAFVVIEEIHPQNTENGTVQQPSHVRPSLRERVVTNLRRFAFRLFPWIGEPPIDNLDDLRKRSVSTLSIGTVHH